MLQKEILQSKGFSVIEDIYTQPELDNILQQIDQANKNKETFRKSEDLFAIRQFLQEVPSTRHSIFNSRLRSILNELFGTTCFVVKSIYFDKPQSSNWYVSYHQDLTISVNKKVSLDGFNLWTTKHNQFSVQPPLAVLENVVTIRIHLDDTTENNGALKVIPGSHSGGIYRPENIDWSQKKDVSCNVSKGGIMLMKPLLLHSSARTTNNKRRRVIHIEFSSLELPSELNWAERISLN
jgi:ectoine hydroxylase-related dioxygenase (phytanoyl-CoA dioxygenase family)